MFRSLCFVLHRHEYVLLSRDRVPGIGGCNTGMSDGIPILELCGFGKDGIGKEDGGGCEVGGK